MGIFLAIAALAGCSAEGKANKSVERPATAVNVVHVQAVDIAEGIDVVGSLAPKYTADVKSEYQGRVDQVLVDQWVAVTKGQALARLDTREIDTMVQKAAAAVEAARAGLLQAQVRAQRAEREYQRLLNLKDAGLVTRQAIDEAGTEVQASKATVEAARAQLAVARDDLAQTRTRRDKAVIQAPLDGVVAQRGVNAGDMVGEAGSSRIMFKIVDNRLLDLTVTVPSHRMGALAVGQPLIFASDAFAGESFEGKVMFINPMVNEADRSVKVVAEVSNPDGRLKGGLFVKGRIITGRRPNVIQVPRLALTTWDMAAAQAGVLVVAADTARLRKVTTGVQAGDQVEITGGLSAGELLVVRGGFNVKDGDRVQIKENE
jgi:RND family efflux transporter MFP subunit